MKLSKSLTPLSISTELESLMTKTLDKLRAEHGKKKGLIKQSDLRRYALWYFCRKVLSGKILGIREGYNVQFSEATDVKATDVSGISRKSKRKTSEITEGGLNP